MHWNQHFQGNVMATCAMTRKLTVFVAWIQEILPTLSWYHWCMNTYAVVTKKIPKKLKQTLNDSKLLFLLKANNLIQDYLISFAKVWTVKAIKFYYTVTFVGYQRSLDRFFLLCKISIFVHLHSFKYSKLKSSRRPI